MKLNILKKWDNNAILIPFLCIIEALILFFQGYIKANNNHIKLFNNLFVIYLK